ncbi:hypothetical protein DL765_001442 [Monosporascus sp. GIB2]|nr:hypothetical protein DL765_001442 [Monosporascus sp. GIB2]
MQPSRSQQRAPGSFSPLPGSVSISSSAAAAAASSAAPSSSSTSSRPARPQIRRIETSSGDEDDTNATSNSASASLSLHPNTSGNTKSRSPQTPAAASSSSFANFGQHANSSTSSLQLQQQQQQNFSRPGRPSNEFINSARTGSPLTLPPSRTAHVRKHSQTQGHFEPTLPSASSSNLSHIAMAQRSDAVTPSLSASQAAALAAMQNQQHNRHRSQTVPFPGSEGTYENGKRAVSKPNTGPLSTPTLSLTEASAPRDNGFGSQGNQGHQHIPGGNPSSAATAAANVVFPRQSPQSSPIPSLPMHDPLPPPPLVVPEKPAKQEKSKVKLFSRPKKIETKSDSKEKPLPSPGKIGSALASLQRGNYSTTSLADQQSFYSLGNSSSATIRPIDSGADKEGKEKKHHFLSRQKHKLSSKDEYHLPLSSASSNSRPVDPTAPTSLYNFNAPPSPVPSSSLGKSVSGLDLRHGGRALREKRREDKLDIMRHDNESVLTVGSEWPGPGSLGASGTGAPLHYTESLDPGRYGLSNGMGPVDAWPALQAALLNVFQGEDPPLCIEDYNRMVVLHIQYCVQRRSGSIIIEDLRDLLATGFASLDHTLRSSPGERLIPTLVELWIFTFTSILPYMQAVFLPLDLEFQGCGSLLPPEQARDFWTSELLTSFPSRPLDVRSLVLIAYRDTIIIPRYDKLKTIFSRLSLEHLPSSLLSSLSLTSPPPTTLTQQDSLASTLSTSPNDSYPRPGTAMSLDPSVASYNSSSTTLLGDSGSIQSRSRAISNVSYGSGGSDPQSAGAGTLLRPFTPQVANRTAAAAAADREQNVEDSKQVTEMVGRMLQCMSVLASVTATGIEPSASGNTAGAAGGGGDEGHRMVTELGRLLKLNWLGRGRTGRNRRGIVGGRVKREESGVSGGSGRTSTSIGGIGREGIREGVEVS